MGLQLLDNTLIFVGKAHRKPVALAVPSLRHGIQDCHTETEEDKKKCRA